MSSVAEATTDMLTAYHELNGDIHIVSEEPSPLAFMRYVAKNRPLIVRQGCSKWRAVSKWDAAYLQEVMKDMPVKVAVTPYGLVRWALQKKKVKVDTEGCQSNADSAVKSPDDGLTYFVKPFELVRTSQSKLFHFRMIPSVALECLLLRRCLI